jgi:hypothetical protein
MARAAPSGSPGVGWGDEPRTRRASARAECQKVLPLRAGQTALDAPVVLAALDGEPSEGEHERAMWRVRLAERRMREAFLALEEAEQRGARPGES